MKTDTDSSTLIARTLELEFGTAPYQHIGLFAGEATDGAAIPAAQQAFARLLQATVLRTCPAGSRVLLLGRTLGQLGTELGAAGVAVELVDGAAALDALPPDYVADYAVVAGTYHYLEQLPILSQCRAHLRAGAHLLVFGEFLRDDSAIAGSTLANLSSLRQLAARLGYRLQTDRDLSADALKSVQLFSGLLRRHERALCAPGGIPDADFAAATATFATMERELLSGRRCFQLVELGLPQAGDTTHLGEYARAEYADRSSFEISEIANLFEQSFDKPFNAELWRWKYDGGDGKCVVARSAKGADIIAHYGGAPRQILYFGQPAVAIQVCDVMVLPEQRRQYGKSSLFFKVAATFLEREIGNTVGHLLGFGFPNQKAMNIATRLGLYDKTDDFVQLEFPAADPGPVAVTPEELDIDSEDHREALDRLWQEMAGAYAGGIIGRRDSDYIRYRYFAHPYGRDGLYRRLLLRDGATGAPRACVVLKAHDNGQLIMDLICAPAQMPGIVRGVRQWLAQWAPEAPLRMWLTRGWLPTLQSAGVIVNELGIEIPCNSWNPGPAAATLYGKWWLTAGDMDFM